MEVHLTGKPNELVRTNSSRLKTRTRGGGLRSRSVMLFQFDEDGHVTIELDNYSEALQAKILNKFDRIAKAPEKAPDTWQDTVNSASRKELQELAKEHGIAANLSSLKITDELLQVDLDWLGDGDQDELEEEDEEVISSKPEEA